MLKYKKMPKLKENLQGIVVLLWSFNVVLMSCSYIAVKMHSAPKLSTVFLFGFNTAMMFSNYMCYKLHNVKDMIEKFKVESDKFIENTKLLLKAEDVLNEHEEKGF